MEEPEDGASWFLSNLHPIQTPAIISLLRADQEEFRKLSRGFFFWSSPIEPCQEKIISLGKEIDYLQENKKTWEGGDKGQGKQV